MSDQATSRIPRDTLAGLLGHTFDAERERITAPMPAVRLDELLEGEESVVIVDRPLVVSEDSSGDLVVRFNTGTETSRYIILWSFALTLLFGALLIVLV